MRISFLNGIVLSLGFIAVLSALAFPSVGLSSRDVSQRVDGFESHGIVGHLGSRSPRARGGGKSTRPRPSRSSNKKTSNKKKNSTKKKSSAKKKVPVKGKTTTRKKKKSTVRKKKPVKKHPTKKRPTSRKPTRTRSVRPSITKRPTSTKHKSSSTVKLLPFTLPPRPTVASDVCLLPGIDCSVDLKARSEVSHNFTARSFRNPSFEKRNRNFHVQLKSGKLKLQEKGYYYFSQLESGDAGSRWVEAWVDYETLLVKDVEVKLYNTKPPHLIRTPSRLYRSEHVLELQSMSRFIESLTDVTSNGNKIPIQMSVTVDDRWFTEWWHKDVQDRIDTRSPTFKGYENSANILHKDKSLNDIIFEAMGSKRNVEDFVLCEDGINSVKAKLWMNKDPFADWDKEAPKAAQGLMASEKYLSAFRATIAVYNYIELPQVTKKLRSTIKKVETEFRNVAHLTNNELPKDTSGQDVDLAALWIEFMDKQLARFAAKGQEWLRIMIALGIKEFEAELKIMNGWHKTMHTSLSNTVKERYNNAVREHALAVKQLQSDEKQQAIATKNLKKELEKLQNKFNNDKTSIDNEKKRIGSDYNKASKKLTSATRTANRTEKKKGAALRKILQHDKDDLPKQIKNWQAIIAQLHKFDAERQKIRVLRAK